MGAAAGEEDDNGASFLAGSTKAKAGEDAGSKWKNKAPAGGFGANAMEEDDEDFFPDFGVDDLDEDEGAAQPAKKAPAKPTFSNTAWRLQPLTSQARRQQPQPQLRPPQSYPQPLSPRQSP
ncbi:hypothetical protein OEZ86_009550 [Tetradesmus obliquus]|uniref:Tuftelin interacting protein N-terminal domain-containing protein n=1 Tax=Tetradesmus obliquus TaxID=3088 RepID=A0ABY8UQJ2_TETOB|nr:hypothetical protein OEZ85_000996 [Tetradesmus obliquus]WIA43015.1 hypothetical protein OEZ86_009550 [Tetradesmus obliquus]